MQNREASLPRSYKMVTSTGKVEGVRKTQRDNFYNCKLPRKRRLTKAYLTQNLFKVLRLYIITSINKPRRQVPVDDRFLNLYVNDGEPLEQLPVCWDITIFPKTSKKIS